MALALAGQVRPAVGALSAAGVGIVRGVPSNVEVVRRAYAAFDQRDPEALVTLCAPAMIFEPVTARITAGGEPYQGHDGLRRYFHDITRVWQELQITPDRFYAVGSEIIVATGRVHAWGVGRVIDHPAGWFWRLEGGAITYCRVYESTAGALDAAGIDAAAPTVD